MPRKTTRPKRAERWRLLHQLAARRLHELSTDPEFHIIELPNGPLDDELVERLYPDGEQDAVIPIDQNAMPIDQDLDSADWYELYRWQ
jgi:hypothetical protein